MTLTLKGARANSDLTQAKVVYELQEKFGITIPRQRLAEYEKEPNKVPIEVAKALTKIYNVSLNDIFFGV